MSNEKTRPDPITRVVFDRPVRFPDLEHTELSSWFSDSHAKRCTAEMGPGNAVLLRGPRGTTLVPAARVMYVEMWQPVKVEDKAGAKVEAKSA